MLATAPRICCPRCECGHLDTVDKGIGWGGRPFRVFICRNCSKRFRRFMPRAGSVAPPVTHAEPIELSTREPQSQAPDPSPPTRWIYGKPERCKKCKTMGRVASTRKRFRWVICPNRKCKQPNWKEPGRAV